MSSPHKSCLQTSVTRVALKFLVLSNPSGKKKDPIYSQERLTKSPIPKCHEVVKVQLKHYKNKSGYERI